MFGQVTRVWQLDVSEMRHAAMLYPEPFLLKCSKTKNDFLNDLMEWGSLSWMRVSLGSDRG